MSFRRKRHKIERVVWLLMLALGKLSYSYADEDDKLAFTYTTDREVEAKVYLAFSNDGLPDYYYCDLHTPICLEDLCNPIELRLVWDLLGNFRNYLETPGKEITKFDHEPFEPNDHQQLKAILRDKESLLRDYRMEDLVDTTRKVYSAEIDGLTAATNTTFAEKLVPGAIYTCYTLWHVINGEIASKIADYTGELMSGELKRKMLTSAVTPYQDYVLDGMSQDERLQYSSELFELIASKNRYIAVKSIRNLPPSGLVKNSLVAVIGRFASYDFPVQTALIQYFTKEPCDAELLQAWITRVHDALEKHRVALFKFFEAKLSCMSRESIVGLVALLEERAEDHDSHDKRLLMFLKNKL